MVLLHRNDFETFRRESVDRGRFPAVPSLQPANDVALPSSEIGGVPNRVIASRGRKNRGQQGCLLDRKILGGLSEMVARRRFRSKDALAPFGDIQIQFENLLFRQMVFQGAGDQGLPGFPQQRPFG